MALPLNPARTFRPTMPRWMIRLVLPMAVLATNPPDRTERATVTLAQAMVPEGGATLATDPERRAVPTLLAAVVAEGRMKDGMAKWAANKRIPLAARRWGGQAAARRRRSVEE
jgi:hypothetical protein